MTATQLFFAFLRIGCQADEEMYFRHLYKKWYNKKLKDPYLKKWHDGEFTSMDIFDVLYLRGHTIGGLMSMILDYISPIAWACKLSPRMKDKTIHVKYKEWKGNTLCYYEEKSAFCMYYRRKWRKFIIDYVVNGKQRINKKIYTRQKYELKTIDGTDNSI